MKHKFFSRLGAALLSVTTVLSGLSLGVSAFAVDDGTVLYRTETPLADGLMYETVLAGQDSYSQNGYLFTYTGGGAALPVVTAGDYIRGRETLGAMVSSWDNGTWNDDDVVGAVNGDFFSMATGIPMGIMVRDGVLLSSDAGENAFGITSDGTPLIGKPAIGITLHRTVKVEVPPTETTPAKKTETTDKTAAPMPVFREETVDIRINHLNKHPSVWGAYLCTPDHGKTTGSEEAGTEYVFRLDAGAFTLAKQDAAEPRPDESATDTAVTEYAQVTATLTEIRRDTVNGAIPKDGFVIVVHNKATNANEFTQFAVGEQVTLSLTCADGWEDVTFAVGGGDILCENGVVKTAFNADHANTRNPRTAIGYTYNGEIKVFAVDGRSSKSRGMTLAELAETMQSFGCVGALNLDGGGSTTVLVRENDGAMIVANEPTDGYTRSISNGILFVNTATSDGIPAIATVTPASPIVFGDTPVQLDTVLYDRSMTPVTAENLYVTWMSSGGIIDENRILRPHSAEAGVIRVDARIHIPHTESTTAEDGTAVTVTTETVITATTSVYKVNTLDGIRLDRTSLAVANGAVSDPLTVTGTWRGYDVLVHPVFAECAFVTVNGTHIDAIINPDAPETVTWGYVDSALSVHNTANKDTPVTATLAVLLDDGKAMHATYLPVTFGALPATVLDMEAKDIRTVLALPDGTVGSFSRLTGGGREGSAAAVVSASQIAPTATPRADNPVRAIDLYIKGTLPTDAYATVTYRGTRYTLPWTVADDFSRLTGWDRITLDLTSLDENGIRDFTIDVLLGAKDAFDLTMDDMTYDFGDREVIYTDIADSWAKDDVLRVTRLGVINGIPQADGTYTFDPTGLLTRAAFAKTVCLLAGLTPLDAEAAEAEIAAFADADTIADWAKPYIAAVTKASLMRGKPMGDALLFAPDAPMTRAEVLQVLGTLIGTDGTPTDATIPTFLDDEDIPAWARENIGICLSAGIVTGFSDNTLRALQNITRAEIAALLVRTNSVM